MSKSVKYEFRSLPEGKWWPLYVKSDAEADEYREDYPSSEVRKVAEHDTPVAPEVWFKGISGKPDGFEVDATLPAAPAPTEQPEHETIVREGNMLTCTACGTSKKMVDPCAAPTEQAGELPPYVYARECGPNEKVWTEDAVRKLMAARQAPTEQPKGLPTLHVPITDDEMAALRRFDECARDGAGYDVGTDMMKALASIGLVRHLSAGRYEHTSFGLAVLSGNVAEQAPDSRDAARYRFVRQHPAMTEPLIKNLMVGNLPLDESIDSAIQSAQEKAQ